MKGMARLDHLPVSMGASSNRPAAVRWGLVSWRAAEGSTYILALVLLDRLANDGAFIAAFAEQASVLLHDAQPRLEGTWRLLMLGVAQLSGSGQ
jgi:hypothetical protein